MLDTIRAKRDDVYAIAKKHKAEKLWVLAALCRPRLSRGDTDMTPPNLEEFS